MTVSPRERLPTVRGPAASFYNYHDSKESMVREYDDSKLTALTLFSMLVDDEAGPI